MAEACPVTGMVGPFWVVEDRGSAVLIAYAVPLDQAEPYVDMLTVDTGHFEYWSELARRSASALREAGIPAAPIWSEYDEWPRGRVLYDRTAQRFVIRSDRQLHRPPFVRLIAGRFRVAVESAMILPDD